jgi:hypothetical protein
VSLHNMDTEYESNSGLVCIISMFLSGYSLN